MDITMCKDNKCPAKDSCHRFTARPDTRQAWFAESPRKKNSCDFYWGDKADSIYSNLKEIMS